MTMTPHIDPADPLFPGDATPQPPFGFRDTLRSLALWSVGVPHLICWSALVVGASKFIDLRRVDPALKLMARVLPRSAGVDVAVRGRGVIDPTGAYVFVVNHVNIFDVFAIYQAIPQYTRSLEHVDHFSWPIFGPLITAAGQIPVDPKDPRVTARGLKRAAEMLVSGDSLVVLPEGQRTLDGSVGRFYPGAFRLAIQAHVPVVPLAIKGGRAVSRRGDWRVRPGTMEVLFGAPVPTTDLRLKDAADLSARCRSIIIELLQGTREPGA